MSPPVRCRRPHVYPPSLARTRYGGGLSTGPGPSPHQALTRGRAVAAEPASDAAPPETGPPPCDPSQPQHPPPAAAVRQGRELSQASAKPPRQVRAVRSAGSRETLAGTSIGDWPRSGSIWVSRAWGATTGARLEPSLQLTNMARVQRSSRFCSGVSSSTRCEPRCSIRDGSENPGDAAGGAAPPVGVTDDADADDDAAAAAAASLVAMDESALASAAAVAGSRTAAPPARDGPLWAVAWAAFPALAAAAPRAPLVDLPRANVAARPDTPKTWAPPRRSAASIRDSFPPHRGCRCKVCCPGKQCGAACKLRIAGRAANTHTTVPHHTPPCPATARHTRRQSDHRMAALIADVLPCLRELDIVLASTSPRR